MLPLTMDEGLSDLEQLSSGDSDELEGPLSKKSTLRKKSVSFYDPEPDALALAAALVRTFRSLSFSSLLGIEREEQEDYFLLLFVL